MHLTPSKLEAIKARVEIAPAWYRADMRLLIAFVEECLAESQAQAVPPGSRRTDPSTSARGEEDVIIRAGSQRALFLRTFCLHDREEGMTADEAQIVAGADPASCYWKRVSELHHFGWLVQVGERRGRRGSAQRACRITALGRMAALDQKVVAEGELPA